MYLNLKVNNDCSHWQQSQCNLSQFSSALILIDTVVILIIWDDNEYIIIVYRVMSSMIRSLTVAATLTEMFWCITTFQKECYTVSLTVSITVRNQHTLTLNQNCVNVQWLMSSYLIWCNTKLYEWDVHIKQHENDSCLTKVSIKSKLLLINLENRIDTDTYKNESSNISIV